MIFLTHLLEHLGVPSGAAIAIVISAQKFLMGGAAKRRARPSHDDRRPRHPHDCR